jgi:outer membrane protein, multidrug efflux system
MVASLAACNALPTQPTTGAAGIGLAATADLPSQWQGASALDASARRWADGFADPLLPALVDEALAANLDLQTASAALRRARALRELTAAAQAVQVGSSASVGRNRSGGQSGNSLRVGLDASWEADLFGAQGAALAAAQAGAEASAATLQATRLAVAAETALTYVSWQGLRRQMDVAAASLASQTQTDGLVRARVAAGLATPLDQAQSTATLAQTRARLPALQHSLTQAEHTLAVLLAQTPDALSARLAAAPRALPLPPDLPALPVPADWLRRRPDLQAAERNVAAELATLTQRQADRLPRFTVSGSLALQAATLSALSGPGALVAGLAAGINWPLFDGGAGAAQVAAQQAALDAARLTWRAAVLTALQDVEDSLSSLATNRTRVETLRVAAQAADEALRLARHRWESGLSDYASLLDNERTALSTADTLAGAQTELVASHIRLLKAMGGGMGVGMGVSTTPAADPTRTSGPNANLARPDPSQPT